MKWSEAYEHSGWTIAVPVKLIHAIGAKGAILVSQLFYWKGKEQAEDGWIYKTKTELEAETGLSRYEQDTCTEDLKQKKILVTHYDRLDHRLYYRICTEALDAIMEADLPGESGKSTFGKSSSAGGQSPSESGKPAFAKGPKQLSPRCGRRVGESGKSSFGIKTQNNTPENTTTTPCARGDSKAADPTKPAAVVVVSSGSGFYEAQAEDDAETLEDLETDFGLNPEQAGKLRVHHKRRGIAYVEEKAELTRAEPRKNAAAFFMLALEKNWKAPVKLDKKVKPTKPEPSKEKVPARPDYSAQWELWQRASDEQREAWRQDHIIRQTEPKPGEKPRTAFLARLHGLTQPEGVAA